MSLNSEQTAGVTFCNLGRFVETLTGKNTFFDKVGIAYQSLIQQLDYLNNSTDTSSVGFEVGVKRNRSEQEDITLEVQIVPKKRS